MQTTTNVISQENGLFIPLKKTAMILKEEKDHLGQWKKSWDTVSREKHTEVSISL